MFKTQKGTTFILNIFPESAYFLLRIILKHIATFSVLKSVSQIRQFKTPKFVHGYLPKYHSIINEIFTETSLVNP